VRHLTGEPVKRRFFLFWRHGCSAAAKFACLQRQKPAMFAQTPLFVYRHFTGAVCTTILLRASSEPPPPWVACCAHQVQNFDLSQRFWCRGPVGAMASTNKYLAQMNKSPDGDDAT